MDLFPEGSNDTLVYQSCSLLDIMTILNFFFFFNEKAKAFEDPLSAEKALESPNVEELLKSLKII